MITLSHPMGNNFVRAILSGLSQADMLESFQTCIAVDSKTPWLSLLPESVRQEFLRRNYPIDQSKIHQYPMREIVRLSAGKLGLTSFTQHEQGYACIDKVFSELDERVAAYLKENTGASQAIYAYEDGALHSFRQAKTLGLKCLYDLPIAYWQTSRHLLDEEALRLPDWEPTLGGTRDSSQKLARKEEEASLADVIVVPSSFVYETLPNDLRNSKRVVVAEFGSPEPRHSSINSTIKDQSISDRNKSLRFLFCGSMSQRKGLADIFAAFRLLNNPQAQLVVMGSPILPLSFYYQQYPDFIHEPVRPNHKVLELMESCDVFILPSIVEGRAQVQQEAMTCGLPIITTKNAGGEDLIDEGKTGFLVPVRSPEIIAQKLNWFLENRDKLPEMSKLSQAKAAQVTWDRYRSKIIKAIKEELARGHN